MLSDELQKALDAAFLSARGDGHDLLTVEHLLLALLSDANVNEVLGASGADLEALEQGLHHPLLLHIFRNRSKDSIEIHRRRHLGIQNGCMGEVSDLLQRVQGKDLRQAVFQQRFHP